MNLQNLIASTKSFKPRRFPQTAGGSCLGVNCDSVLRLFAELLDVIQKVPLSAEERVQTLFTFSEACHVGVLTGLGKGYVVYWPSESFEGREEDENDGEDAERDEENCDGR